MNKSVRVGAAVIVAILVLAAIGLGAPGFLAGQTHTMTVQFPTADGLLGGSDVLEAGAEVGTVSDVQPQTNNTAIVTLSIDDAHWPLHAGVTAAIRPKSLLGEKYVALTDGSDNAAYDASTTLVESQAAVPVELDQFVDSLDPQTRAAAQTLLDDLGAGVAGQGTDINAMVAAGKANLANLATTGKTLNDRDPDLDRILVSLDALLGKLTTNAELTQFQELINNGQQTLNAVETQRAALQRSFIDADATLTNLNTALDSSIPALEQTLSTAPSLVKNLSVETKMLSQLAAGVNNDTVLPELIGGVEHGPTATGGALETTPDGTTQALFRICLITPTPGACTGSGTFAPPSAIATVAQGRSSDLVAFAGWIGS